MGNGGRIKGGIVFSGRFCPPHPGHFQTIYDLAEKYDKVIVVILDYPDRKWSIAYTKYVFNKQLYHCRHRNIEIKSNKTHFAKVQLGEWQSYFCKYYAAGNLAVLRHMELIGADCVYTERSFEYEAHKYPPPT